jgi:hypothetical protein
VHREALGQAREGRADLVKGFLGDGGLATLVLVLFLAIQMRPAPVQPVGLVGL